MRLTDIQADAGRRLGFDPGVDSVALTRITAFANTAQRKILQIKHFRKYRRRPLTVASTANSPYMALPVAAVRIFGIQDRTNDLWLKEKDLAYIRQIDPGLRATTANPWLYAPYDLASPVAVQPSAAAEIFVKSTAAGDVGTAYIEGIRTGGYPTSLSAVMTGVTAKSLSTVQTDIVALNKFFLSAAAVGTVTLHSVSGAGTELARIPIGGTFARYQTVHLYPTPTAAVTYNIDAEVQVEDMAVANDEPLVPEDFHDLISIGIRMMEYEKREKWDGYAAMRVEWVEEVAKMKTWVNQQEGSMSDTAARHSQLGPWFEPGS